MLARFLRHFDSYAAQSADQRALLDCLAWQAREIYSYGDYLDALTDCPGMDPPTPGEIRDAAVRGFENLNSDALPMTPTEDDFSDALSIYEEK